MKERCLATSPDRAYYFDKGVTVYDGWLNSFELFYSHVGPRPSSSHSLDRFPDPDGNYEPGNVRWATASEQALNRRNASLLTVNGITKNLTTWATDLALPDTVIIKRLRRGWKPEDAIAVGRDRRSKKLNPEQVRVIRRIQGLNLQEIASVFSVSRSTISEIQRGLTWNI